MSYNALKMIAHLKGKHTLKWFSYVMLLVLHTRLVDRVTEVRMNRNNEAEYFIHHKSLLSNVASHITYQRGGDARLLRWLKTIC